MSENKNRFKKWGNKRRDLAKWWHMTKNAPIKTLYGSCLEYRLNCKDKKEYYKDIDKINAEQHKINKKAEKGIKEANFIDTLMCYAFFAQPENMFYELLHETRKITCDECGDTSIGYKMIIMLLKFFGGATIHIPSINELEIYKFLILRHDVLIDAYMSKQKERPEQNLAFALKKVGIKVTSEVVLKDIMIHLAQTFFSITESEEIAWREKKILPKSLEQTWSKTQEAKQLRKIQRSKSKNLI